MLVPGSKVKAPVLQAKVSRVTAPDPELLGMSKGSHKQQQSQFSSGTHGDAGGSGQDMSGRKLGCYGEGCIWLPLRPGDTRRGGTYGKQCSIGVSRKLWAWVWLADELRVKPFCPLMYRHPVAETPREG